jgi:hypothetical protein
LIAEEKKKVDAAKKEVNDAEKELQGVKKSVADADKKFQEVRMVLSLILPLLFQPWMHTLETLGSSRL